MNKMAVRNYNGHL